MTEFSFTMDDEEKIVPAVQGEEPVDEPTKRQPGSSATAGRQSKNKVWWHVNTGGFPVPEQTWQKMWDHVAEVHPSGAALVEKIREAHLLPKVRIPYQPLLRAGGSVGTHLEEVQRYLSALQYNHTGTQFFDIQKDRPVASLMEKAKEMISASLPIKCLEGVVLGLYLTRNIVGLDRFVISFKSRLGPHSHKHVVMGVHHSGSFGALGLSRRSTLMYKSLAFGSLCDLVEDFRQAYADCHHKLLVVKLSDTVSSDELSRVQIDWKYVSIKLDADGGQPLSAKAKQKLVSFSRELHSRAHVAQKEAHSPRKSAKTC